MRHYLRLALVLLAGCDSPHRTPPAAAGHAFDPHDAQRTLRWLVQDFERFGALLEGNDLAGDEAGQEFARALRRAEGQAIAWSVPLRAVRRDGPQTARLLLDPITHAGKTLDLELPDAGGQLNVAPGLETDALLPLRPGDPVTVAGVLRRIDFHPTGVRVVLADVTIRVPSRR